MYNGRRSSRSSSNNCDGKQTSPTKIESCFSSKQIRWTYIQNMCAMAALKVDKLNGLWIKCERSWWYLICVRPQHKKKLHTDENKIVPNINTHITHIDHAQYVERIGFFGMSNFVYYVHLVLLTSCISILKLLKLLVNNKTATAESEQPPHRAQFRSEKALAEWYGRKDRINISVAWNQNSISILTINFYVPFGSVSHFDFLCHFIV